MKIPSGLKSVLLPNFVPKPARCFSVSYGGLALTDLTPFLGDLPTELEKAVDKRKIDFITGRICASQALSALDSARDWPAVAMNSERLPVWPAGVVGSITHTEGFSSAYIGRAEDFQSLGIDAEKIMPLAQAEKIKATICFDAERELVGSDLATSVSLIFSAKESLFKCLYPLVKMNFGFLDAQLNSLDSVHQSFSIELLRDLSDQYKKGAVFLGNYVFEKSYIVTRIALAQKTL